MFANVHHLLWSALHIM